MIKLDEHIMIDKTLCERLEFGLEIRQKDKAMLLWNICPGVPYNNTPAYVPAKCFYPQLAIHPALTRGLLSHS